MRHLAPSLLLAGAMLLSAPAALQSQVPGPPVPPGAMSPAWGEGPARAHAAVVALQDPYTLGLSTEQIRQIRQIQNEMLAAVIPIMMAQGSDTIPSAWWYPGVEINEEELRALHQRHAVQEADLTLSLLKASRAVFEVLSAEQQQSLRRMIDSWAPVRDFAPSRSNLPCTEGSAVGSMSLSGRTALSYSLEFRGDSARIQVLFVGRAEEPFGGTAAPRDVPNPPGASRILMRTPIGSWTMLYDEEQHLAWVHTERVPIEEKNVVLVHGVDRPHERPTVVGTLRIPPAFHTGGCPEGVNWLTLLRDHVDGVLEIREFLRGMER